MKGVFFQQPLEFRLEVTGEDFHQGDTLPCVLSVKNHGGSTQSLTDLHLHLAQGDQKKVKQKEAGAFNLAASAEYAAPVEVGAQQSQALPWTFQLDKNCLISDKAQSLYLLYGNAGDYGALGQLPVTVQPHPHILVVIRILETAFNFVLKGQKSSKGWVAAKFKAPAARRFSLVEYLTLSFRFDGDLLLLNYHFHVKKFDATTASVGVKKGSSEVEQRLDPAQYLFPGGMVNHEPLEAAIEEALGTVATGL